MHQFLAAMPPWAPLVVAAIGLAGALAALLYARHAIALASDRVERAQDFERRLLHVLGKHPEILEAQKTSDTEPAPASTPQDELSSASGTLRLRADEDWRSLTFELIAQSRFDEAEAICRRVIEVDPDDAQAHNTLGVIYRKTNRLEAAVAACRQATLLEPSCVAAHINLGVALRNMGRPHQAEAAYRRAIELEPHQVVAHSSLGVALSKQGRSEEAETCYLQAIEIDSSYTPAWLNLAIALQKRGALDEAQAAYRCALELGSETDRAEHDTPDQAAVA